MYKSVSMSDSSEEDTETNSQMGYRYEFSEEEVEGKRDASRQENLKQRIPDTFVEENEISNAYDTQNSEEDSNYQVIVDSSDELEDDSSLQKSVDSSKGADPQDEGSEQGFPSYEVYTEKSVSSDTSSVPTSTNTSPFLSPSTPKRKRKPSKVVTTSQTEVKPTQINTTNCYWNTEFQKALDMNEGRAQWTKLAKLAHDFVYCSKTYGKIIITEYYLPEDEKTIKSIDAGGLAGGSKYVCSNIFFKFALDTDLNEDKRKKKKLTKKQLPPVWMYGGDKPDDYAAMKASKNDMTGLMSYYNAKVAGLYFPLMALIDYRGFRLTAMSILPISRTTIRYGSADGGQTIHKGNPAISEKMKEAAEQLNLKGHRTGLKRVMIHGPGDIEGHEGTDGKFYVVDFGRTFPPEAPSEPGSRKIFYCLLRPEFVRMCKNPLSSDAFSCWGKCNSKIHNQEVRDATQMLYEVTIPNFANELPKLFRDDIRLTEMLHTFGINCRHLGLVRNALPKDLKKPIRRLLLTEMVARLLSGLLRQLLRLEMKRTKVASQEPYKTVVIDFLNALLSNLSESQQSRQDAPEETEMKALREVKKCTYISGRNFWTRDIKHWLKTKFTEKALSDLEQDTSYNLRNSIVIVDLLQRLCEQSGIKLSKHATDEFAKHSDSFQVLNFDLRKVSARVKHLNVIDEAEGNLLFLEAKKHSDREGLWEATNQKFRAAVCSNTNNPATFVRWGSILLKQCNHFRSRSPASEFSLTEKLLDGAKEKFCSALKLNIRMHEAQFELALTHIFKGVLIHLYKPEDTIAVALWQMEQGSQYFYSAFAANSHYFQKVLMQVEEMAEQADDTTLSADVRCELYLRAFFLLHCAIGVAPRLPDPSTFLHAASLVKGYLTVGGKPSICGYLYGIAGSYLESAYLRFPCVSDGKYFYHHQKSMAQMQHAGTKINFSRQYNKPVSKLLSSDGERPDTILLFVKEKDSEQTPLLNGQQLCLYHDAVEVYDVPQEFPLAFYPIISENPSHSYHRARSFNSLFYLLGPFDWGAQQDHMATEAPLLRFSKQSCTFVLCHSPFHSFSISNISILLPVIEISNVGLPSKINFYASNCQDKTLLSTENIQAAIDKEAPNHNEVQNLLNWFTLYSASITPTSKEDGPIVVNISIQNPKPARYLIIDVVPSENAREVGLSKLGFHGYQYFKKSVPHSTYSGLRKANSKKLRKVNSVHRYGPSTEAIWSDRRSNALIVDTKTNSLGLTSEGEIRNIPFTCQSTVPISFQALPSQTKKIPLLRNLASSDLKLKRKRSRSARYPTRTSRKTLLKPVCSEAPLNFHSAQTQSVPPLINQLSSPTVSKEGPLFVLWADPEHDTNDIRTLCQLMKNLAPALTLFQFPSLVLLIEWLRREQKDGFPCLSLSDMIQQDRLRIIVSKRCYNSFVEQITGNEVWNRIPVMKFTFSPNPPQPGTFKEMEGKNIFFTACAKNLVHYASFIISNDKLMEFDAKKKAPKDAEARYLAMCKIEKERNTCPLTTRDAFRIPTDRLEPYFEVVVTTLHPDSLLSIGLAPTEFAIHGIHIGTILKSFAYRSDGTLWVGWGEKACTFANYHTPTFERNDVIGCGYDVHNMQIFWTKNGHYLGTAANGHSKLLDVEVPLFPSVTFTGDCSLSSNFGSRPFLFDLSQLSTFSNPKNCAPKSKEAVFTLHPYPVCHFKPALERHNMELLVLAALAKYSRTLHVLMRVHLDQYQEEAPSLLTQLLGDSPELLQEIEVARPKHSYTSIELGNTIEKGGDFHLWAFSRLLPPFRAGIIYNLNRWTALSDNVFSKIMYPENIHTLLLSNCEFEDGAAQLISERLVNLHSISVWEGISSKSIASICTMPSLRKIDFTNCQNLTDSLLVSSLKKNPSRDSFDSLNFTNCPMLTDHAFSSLLTKCGPLIKGLKSFNVNFCNKVTTSGVSKILNACKLLQHLSLASNPSVAGMNDHVLSHIAHEVNQNLQTLVLVRSTHITASSMNQLAQHCNNITHLDLGHCNAISDSALQNFAKKSKNLIKLDLFNTAIENETALIFVKRNRYLRYLSFGRCVQLSTAGLIACTSCIPNVEFLFLRENSMKNDLLRAINTSKLPCLVLLDLSSCSKLSASAISELQGLLPHIYINTSHKMSKKYQT